MAGGKIGAVTTRAACRTENATRSRDVSNAARISGHRRNGAPATKAGADRQGLSTYRCWRSFGVHPGDGEEARINDVTRSGRVAAYRNAMNPPYETPHKAARSRPVCSKTQSS